MVFVKIFNSPFYEAYRSHREEIDAAIRFAAKESADQMGAEFAELFSVVARDEEQPLAA